MKKRQINKAKRVDHTCRNNGSCSYCKSSRLHQAQKAMVSASQQVDYDLYDEDFDAYANGNWDGIPRDIKGRRDDGWDIDEAQYKMEDR